MNVSQLRLRSEKFDNNYKPFLYSRFVISHTTLCLLSKQQTSCAMCPSCSSNPAFSYCTSHFDRKKLECRCHFEIPESELPLSKFVRHQITWHVPYKQLTTVGPSSSTAYNAVWNINLQVTVLTVYGVQWGLLSWGRGT